jgi:hypothetical protein
MDGWMAVVVEDEVDGERMDRVGEGITRGICDIVRTFFCVVLLRSFPGGNWLEQKSLTTVVGDSNESELRCGVVGRATTRRVTEGRGTRRARRERENQSMDEKKRRETRKEGGGNTE